jgi:hypothetical protein
MKYSTTRQVGDRCGVEEWQVRRLFEDGTLPEPERFGGKRAIPETLIPEIADQLRARGWLSIAAQDEATLADRGGTQCQECGDKATTTWESPDGDLLHLCQTCGNDRVDRDGATE